MGAIASDRSGTAPCALALSVNSPETARAVFFYF